jgi:hypothetical protein
VPIAKPKFFDVVVKELDEADAQRLKARAGRHGEGRGLGAGVEQRRG